jgi:hypothetical protein
MKLQTLLVGETLYCIIGQLDESTKIFKRMHISGSKQDKIYQKCRHLHFNLVPLI